MNSDLLQRIHRARLGARELRSCESGRKNAVLLHLAEALQLQSDRILQANAEDLAALSSETTGAFRDRLTLRPDRLEGMAESLRQVAKLPDPVGEIEERKVLPNGLVAQRMRSPLGVIFMIFESRPNVALEAFSLAFKSGNVILLRGGKESRRTVSVFYSLMRDALRKEGFSEDLVIGIDDPDRELVNELLRRNDLIDVVVPRGGEGLIRAVVEQSTIPIIKNDRGMCHIYIHEDADLDMAVAIIRNAKIQRPGVCNAMETLLIHRTPAKDFLPKLRSQILEVELFCDAESLDLLRDQDRVSPATAESFDTEYLDLQMNVKVVGSLEEATAHIEQHGSRHSEAILTADRRNFLNFRDSVDAAAVYWNASTRFTDGFELGLGGELGISTQKLHVRGPVGLKELTSLRWVIEGTGQTRS